MIKLKNLLLESDLLSKINQLIKQERDAGMEYPPAAAYLNYYKELNSATSKNKIKDLTKEFAEFLAYGDKYSIKDNKLADEIREELHNFLIKKRQQVIPKYDTGELKNFIDTRIIKVREKWDNTNFKNALKKNDNLEYLYDYLIRDIVDVLENPHKIGLPEESEFNSLQKEINSAVSFLKKKGKSYMVYPFDNDKFYNDLNSVIKNTLKKND